jgi:hypothetical protein
MKKRLTSSFPTKLHFEKQNPKRIISSKLDYSFRVLFYL